MKKSLKKLTGIVMIGVLALGALTGCGSQKASAAKDITIGVCAGPYGDMVKKAIAPSLEKKGYQIIGERSSVIMYCRIRPWQTVRSMQI